MRKLEKKTLALDKNMRGGGDNWQRIPARAEGGGHGGRGSVLRAGGTDRDAGPGKVYTGTAAYTVQCTEDGHVLHWVRVEKHQWSDWRVEKEPDCENPGELRSTCAVCGMVRWQRLAPLGHLLQFKPEDERHTIAVCRVCGRTLWRGPARDAAQKKKAARRSRPSTQDAAK